MGLLGKLLETAVDVAKVPVAVVKDVATDSETTSKKVDKVVEDVEECVEDFFDFDWF